MKDPELLDETRKLGAVPLVWAAATAEQAYLNLGDALSPVMVALLSGLPIVHRAHDSSATRMAAVGTIGHSLKGGAVAVWGIGASRYLNPLGQGEKTFYAPPANTRLRVHATRGPVTRMLLGEDNAVGAPVFGDPVWLLPQFYRPTIEKRYDLGVIVHLSDLADRSLDAQTKAELLRYAVPEDFAGRVKIINTVTAIGIGAMKERLDEILSCRRIVSTSLHGMVFAESYGIPCLYFAPRGEGRELIKRPLDPDDGFDLRITDLYLGLGRREIPVYVQPRKKPTHWLRLIRSIDRAWEPVTFDTEPLVQAFPLDHAPMAARPGETIFDDPRLDAIPFQHFRKSSTADHGPQSKPSETLNTPNQTGLWNRIVGTWK